MEEYARKARRALDRLLRGGRELVGDAATGLDQRAAVWRLSKTMQGAARQRQATLLSIGKRVYGLYKAGKVRNADVLADCARIDELTEQIKDLQAQIEALRRPGSIEIEGVEVEAAEPLTEEPAEPQPTETPAATVASQAPQENEGQA